MFKEMRRKNQSLTIEEIQDILITESNGTLALISDNNYPYAVPLNFVYLDEKIYFHCAKVGHKIDAMVNNANVSFAVVAQDKIVSEQYTTYFKSVIAFGKASVIENEERILAFTALVEKYCSDRPNQERQKEINHCQSSLIIGIQIEHLTGKQAMALTKTN